MEDDTSRLEGPLKTGWSRILEEITNQNQGMILLDEGRDLIEKGLKELYSNPLQLSRYRHHLNRRLESIKSEIERLRVLLAKSKENSIENLSSLNGGAIERTLSKLQEEGYSLQLELEGLEELLKKKRAYEHQGREEDEGLASIDTMSS